MILRMRISKNYRYEVFLFYDIVFGAGEVQKCSVLLRKKINNTANHVLQLRF